MNRLLPIDYALHKFLGTSFAQNCSRPMWPVVSFPIIISMDCPTKFQSKSVELFDVSAYRTGTVQYLCTDQYPGWGGSASDSYYGDAFTVTILTEDCLGIPQCFQVNELELCHVSCLPHLSNSLFIVLPFDSVQANGWQRHSMYAIRIPITETDIQRCQLMWHRGMGMNRGVLEPV
jgi:hypothetical protein